MKEFHDVALRMATTHWQGCRCLTWDSESPDCSLAFFIEPNRLQMDFRQLPRNGSSIGRSADTTSGPLKQWGCESGRPKSTYPRALKLLHSG